MSDKLQDIERQPFIDLLVLFTNKTDEYFAKLTDRELIEEYDRLMKLG